MNLKESTIQRPGASNEPEKRLHGRWLMLARIGWIVVAVLAVILIAAGAPLEFQVFQTTISAVCSCPQLTSQQATEFKNLGISLSFYAGTLLAFQFLFVAVWFAVATVIFWRRWGKPDEPLALFVSLTLLTFGAVFPGFLDNVAQQGTVWMLAAKLVSFLGVVSIVLFFYLFPTGRFVPRWTRIMGVVWLLCSLIWIIQTPDSPTYLSWIDTIYFDIYYVFLGVGLCVQVFRYLRVSNLIQRQQTKWVIYSFTLAIGGFLALNVLGQLRFVIPALLRMTEGPLGNFFVHR